MKAAKRTLAILLALVLAVALFAACGSTSSGSTSTSTSTGSSSTGNTSGGTSSVGQAVADTAQSQITVDDPIVEHDDPIKVTVALTNNVSTFSPSFNWNPYVGTTYAGVYERLGEREVSGSENFVGILMKEWENLGNGKWHVTLYDYIVDADGNPFTSSDVEASIIHARDDGSNTEARKMVDFEIINDSEFNLTITSSAPGYFEQFCEGIWMSTDAAYQKAAKDGSICVGTGPYVCKEFVSGSYIICEKHGNYWQSEELTAVTSRSNVDYIRYEIVNEITQMGIAIESPESTQMCAWINESLVGNAREKADSLGITVTSVESIQMKGMCLNASEYSLLHDENLRKAVLYAINNEMLVATALSGVGYVPKTYGSNKAIGYQTKWEDEEYYPYDLEKARDYLEAAGYNRNNAGITLNWFGYASTDTQNVGAVLNACLSELGIKVETTEIEAASVNIWREDPSSGWDMFEASQSLLGPYLYSTMTFQGDINQHTGYALWGLNEEEMQTLVNELQATGDPELLDEYHQAVVDRALWYQYYGNYFTCTHVKEITNIVANFKNNLVVGACTFSEDYHWYAD